MFRLLSSTALALVLAGGMANAQNETSGPAMNEPAPPAFGATAGSSQIIWEKTAGEWLTDDLIGATVVNSSEDSLGEIQQLLVAVQSEDDAGSMKGDAPAYTEEPASMDSADAANKQSAHNFAPEEPLPADEDVAADNGVFSDAIREDETAMAEPLPSEGESVMAPSEPETAALDVTHIVLGVGGFLGIGEKLVAVEADRFEFYKSENGEQKIVLDTTTEELKSLPDFVAPDDGLLGESDEDLPGEQN